MRYLFIFDDSVLIDKVSNINLTKNDTVLLFTVSAKSNPLNNINEILNGKGVNHEALESAILVNDSAVRVRQPYINLIADIPKRVNYHNTDLKKWFAIDQTLSMWWLSLVSEKSTLKSESFNRLSQFDAIIQTVKNHKIEKIIFGSTSNRRFEFPAHARGYLQEMMVA